MRKYPRTLFVSLALCAALSFFIATSFPHSLSASSLPANAGLMQAGIGNLPQGGALYFPQLRLELDMKTNEESLQKLEKAAKTLETKEQSIISEAVEEAADAAREEQDGLNAPTAPTGLGGALGTRNGTSYLVPGLAIAAIGSGILLATLESSGGGEGSSSGNNQNSGSGGNALTGGTPPNGGGGGEGGGAGGEGGGSGFTGGDEGSSNPPVTPEPATAVLMGVGLAWLARRKLRS